MLRYADHHGFPIITFIDTPGAFADLKSEELGQGEAVAYNLRAMFGFKVPIIAVVSGQGGSGGALAIGCANKLFMLENSAFYVASAHRDPAWTSQQRKLAILAMEELGKMDADGLLHHRMMKFRKSEGIKEGDTVEPERKCNMKPSDTEKPSKNFGLESEIDSLNKKIPEMTIIKSNKD